MTATQEQLAALAAMVGITPETHRHLYAPCCHQCNSIDLELTDAGYPSFHCQCGAWQFVEETVFKPNFPALDTAAGDDVFLAPFMRWLASEDFQPKVIGGTVWFEATVEGSDSWQSVEEKHMTLALISACQAAGVEEICEIFGRGDHDAR